jgi:hypothetical protein
MSGYFFVEKGKTYKHFDFTIESMSEMGASDLFKMIDRIAGMNGMSMAGGYTHETDADYKFWPVVKFHLTMIWSEVLGLWGKNG